jgi:hypothetical protein
MMATIKVAINGEPAFTWKGDAVAIDKIMAEFPEAARDVGMTPEALAGASIDHIRTGALLSEDKADQQMHVVSVLWRILNLDAESGNAETHGKIADYAGTFDFEVYLVLGDETLTVEIEAIRARFDA